jgi:[pyruvate, water dikinase]-phosphate phosphotransferase / [pyruvate, water dikinase] kinase
VPQENKQENKRAFHLHLVSDATGETTHSIARACLVQFDDVHAIEHMWSDVRNAARLREVVAGIEANPGPVIYTLVDDRISALLMRECVRMSIPCISVLGTIMQGLATYFGSRIRGQPGRQHQLDEDYFHRIDAIHYALDHDDGQSARSLADAEIVLVGVSRTSKTPTAMYLANHRGLKAANVPYVPGAKLPDELLETGNGGPFVVGLTASPERLVQIRRNRILMLGQSSETAYIDIETVRNEVAEARKLFTRMGWPVIDVTRRSIEETAATIVRHYRRHIDGKQEKAAAGDG